MNVAEYTRLPREERVVFDAWLFEQNLTRLRPTEIVPLPLGRVLVTATVVGRRQVHSLPIKCRVTRPSPVPLGAPA